MISIQPLPLVIQFVSFLLLSLALKRLLFDPFTEVLNERERRTTGARAEASALQNEVAAASSDYDRRLQEVRRSLATELDGERQKVAVEQHAIVAAAQADAGAMLEKERQALQAQGATARTALAERAEELAGAMLERVGGRKFA